MRHLLVVLSVLMAMPSLSQNTYEIKDGKVRFYSEAPEEIIKAYSAELKGIIDFSKKMFACKIAISTFEGFNSALQREHFNENYMETATYPLATFTGKIIEDIDLDKNGEIKLRTKGKLKIHGVEDTRIIPAIITVKKKTVSLEADFTVLLADHHIKIPRVVNNKLSDKIHVSVNARLIPK